MKHAAAKSCQSCPTLCDSIDGSPSGSSVPGILQARILSGLPFPSPTHACVLNCFSHVQLSVTLWTAAHQAPLLTGFSRQEYWSGLLFPSPSFMASNLKFKFLIHFEFIFAYNMKKMI